MKVKEMKRMRREWERGMRDCKSEEHFKTASLIVDVAIVLLETKYTAVYRAEGGSSLLKKNIVRLMRGKGTYAERA